jgi:ABC-type uncharacterized transport system involved in gliding motility auxiliary subunit
MERRQGQRPYTRTFSILGLVTLLAGLVVMLAFPEIRLAALGVMGAGVIFLILALALDFQQVKGALIGRRGRLGAGTTVMAMMFVGIIVLLNGIVVYASQDPRIGIGMRKDVTRLSQFTLTQQTKDVLKNLKQPIKAICFFVPSKDTYGLTAYAESLLFEYQGLNKLISIEIIDPDQHPDRARVFGITQYQTVVFQSGDKNRLVMPSQIIQFDDQGNPQQVEAEHAFTSAILEVTGVAQKRVYFLTGHGEVSPSGSYSSVLNGLRDDLYVVGLLDLASNPVVPDDTAVLIIASPRSPMSPAELDAIDKYLKAGGQALILADPGFPEQLNQLIIPWGVKLVDGTVIDRASYLAPRVDEPRVTPDKNFFAGMGVSIFSYFPGAVAVLPTDNETQQFPPLVYTSTDSWLEKNYDPSKEPTFDPQTDIKGPLALGVPIAAALTNEQKKLTRIIVIGDSDFASNDHFSQVNNGDLFLDSVNWLAEETQLITIHRTALPFRRLVAAPDQVRFITYSSLALPSLLVLLIGVVVWWYRR